MDFMWYHSLFKPTLRNVPMWFQRNLSKVLFFSDIYLTVKSRDAEFGTFLADTDI